MRTNSLEESSSPAADPHAEVEKMYIAEYLKGKGYSVEALAELPKAAAEALMKEASLYASLKLAELETGAALVGTLHLDDSMTTAPRVEQQG
jgi:hypothetical protein